MRRGQVLEVDGERAVVQARYERLSHLKLLRVTAPCLDACPHVEGWLGSESDSFYSVFLP